MVGVGNLTEQRVSGGRLFIQNGRNLATKVLGGVEVIVRGDKTAFIGFERTPIFPSRVSNKPTTFPPSTVSRQFQLVEHPGKPNIALDHLLQSIVRSATPDFITKSFLTTFTFYETLLRNHSTTVKSSEEIITNVVTEKFRPTIEYTPSLKAEKTLTLDLNSFLDKSYITDTMTTIYTYLNSFQPGEGGPPVVITSLETVTNVITFPAYTEFQPHLYTTTRIFETETYLSTITFSKFITPAMDQSHYITTKETITQVVVTEANIPTTRVPVDHLLLTPMPPQRVKPTLSLLTFITTFTSILTSLDGDRVVVTSSISLLSNIVTPTSGFLMSPTFLPPELRTSGILLEPTSIQFGGIKKPWKSQIRPINFEAVMILATRTKFTTFTYYTTVLGGKNGKETEILSRTQVVSKIETEALSTALNAEYIDALKSSYLEKHSTLIEMTSSVNQIIPTRTYQPILLKDSTYGPYYPKDNDQFEFEMPPQKASQQSSEQFDEMKEEINHIVSVLADSHSSSDVDMEFIAPSKITTRPLFTTYIPVPPAGSEGIGEYEEVTLKNPDEYDQYTTTEENYHYLDRDRPVSHFPTPPLSSIKNSNFNNNNNKPSIMSQQQPSHFQSSRPNNNNNDRITQFKPIPQDVMISLKEKHRPSGQLNWQIPKPKPNINQEHHFIINKHKGPGSNEKVDPTKQILSILSEITDTDEFYDGSKEKDVYKEVYTEETESPNIFHIYPIPTTINPNRNKDKYKEKVKPETTSFRPIIVNKEKPPQSTATGDKITLLKPNINKVKPEIKPLRPPTLLRPHSKPVQTTTEYKKTTTTTTPPTTTTTKGKPSSPSTEDTTVKISNEDEASETFEATEESVEPYTTPQSFLSGENLELLNNGGIPISVIINENSKDSDEDSFDIQSNIKDEEEAASADDLTINIHADNEDAPELVLKLSPNKSNRPTLEQIYHKIPGGSSSTSSITSSSTTKKPAKPYIVKRTNKKKPTLKPIVPLSDEEEYDVIESSTGIYVLRPFKDPHGSAASMSTEEEIAKEEDNSGEKTKDEDDAEEDDSFEGRPSGIFSGGGGPPLLPISGPSGHPHSGPSKSTLLNGGGLVGVNSVTSPTGAGGINWKPLLNLGAIGLGGLGASALTKLGPVFNTMAGYIKSGLLPIARNDTQKNEFEEAYISRLPPHESTHFVGPHNQPHFIPVGSMSSPDGSHHHHHIPFRRRPVMSHVKDPNFQQQQQQQQQQSSLEGDSSEYYGHRYDITHFQNSASASDTEHGSIASPSSSINKFGEHTGSSLEKPQIGPHPQTQPPQQQQIKVIPTGNQLIMQQQQSNNNNNRRPPFLRPPPRSQESPHNGHQWPPQNHIIIPHPPREILDVIRQDNQKRQEILHQQQQHNQQQQQNLESQQQHFNPHQNNPHQQQNSQEFNSQSNENSETIVRRPITPDNIVVPHPTQPNFKIKNNLNNNNNNQGENRPGFSNNNNNNGNNPSSSEESHDFVKIPITDSEEFVNQYITNNNRPQKNSGENFNFQHPNNNNNNRFPAGMRHPLRPPQQQQRPNAFQEYFNSREQNFPHQQSIEKKPFLNLNHHKESAEISPPHIENFSEGSHQQQNENQQQGAPQFYIPENPTRQNGPPPRIEDQMSPPSSNTIPNHFNRDRTPNLFQRKPPPPPMNSQEQSKRPPNVFHEYLSSREQLFPQSSSGSGENRPPNFINQNHPIRGGSSKENQSGFSRPFFNNNNNFVHPANNPENPFRPINNLFPTRFSPMPPHHPNEQSQRPHFPNRETYEIVTAEENSQPNNNNNRFTPNQHQQQPHPSIGVWNPANSQEIIRVVPTPLFGHNQIRPAPIGHATIEQIKNEHFPSVHPLSPPPPPHQQFHPTPHFPPYKIRPSTVFIVHETYDLPSTEGEHHSSPSPTTPSPPPPLAIKPSQTTPSRVFPQLVIKEIPSETRRPILITTPRTTTTTITSTSSTENPLTTSGGNKATISKLNFIRRFTTPVPTTTPSSTTTTSTFRSIITPQKNPFGGHFVISPKIKELVENSNNNHNHRNHNYNKRPSLMKNKNQLFSGGDSNPTTSKIPFTSSNSLEEDEEENDENSLSSQKPLVDLNKFYSNEKNFGGDYSGSELKVVKTPFESTQLKPTEITASEEEAILNGFKIPENIFSSTHPSSGQNRRPWWSTSSTLKPNNNSNPGGGLFSSTSTSSSEELKAEGNSIVRSTQKVTTLLDPTTYRPSSSSSTNKVTASSSLLDEREGLEQVKLKNVEIHKIFPGGFMNNNKNKENGGGGGIEDSNEYNSGSYEYYDEDELNQILSQSHQKKNLSTSINDIIKNNNSTELVESSSPVKIPVDSQEEFASTYELETFEEPLHIPRYPNLINRLQRPVPPNLTPPNFEFTRNRNNNLNLNNNNGGQIFFRNPPQSQRPQNFIKQQQHHPSNRPLIPQRNPPEHNLQHPHLQPPHLRRRPPPLGPGGFMNKKPFQNNFIRRRPNFNNNGQLIHHQELLPTYETVPENKFNNIRPIPLSPNLIEDDQEDNISNHQETLGGTAIPILKSGGDSKKTSSEIYRVKPSSGGVNFKDKNRFKFSGENNNKRRPVSSSHESQEASEEYKTFEDDEILKVPEFRPKPLPPSSKGSHILNENILNQINRPIPSPPTIQSQNKNPNSKEHFFRPNQINQPNTEMEPPPALRLRPPILELPSNGPIRYPKPVGNPRPNLLRPDDDLFKKPSRASSSQNNRHTIASVDHNNKIIATNVFTAIIPSRTPVPEIIVTSQVLASPNLLIINPNSASALENTIFPTSAVKDIPTTQSTVWRPIMGTKNEEEDSYEYTDYNSEEEDYEDENGLIGNLINNKLNNEPTPTLLKPSKMKTKIVIKSTITRQRLPPPSKVLTSNQQPESSSSSPVRPPFSPIRSNILIAPSKTTSEVVVKATASFGKNTKDQNRNNGNNSRRPLFPRPLTSPKPLVQDEEQSESTTVTATISRDRRPFTPIKRPNLTSSPNKPQFPNRKYSTTEASIVEEKKNSYSSKSPLFVRTRGTSSSPFPTSTTERSVDKSTVPQIFSSSTVKFSPTVRNRNSYNQSRFNFLENKRKTSTISPLDEDEILSSSSTENPKNLFYRPTTFRPQSRFTTNNPRDRFKSTTSTSTSTSMILTGSDSSESVVNVKMETSTSRSINNKNKNLTNSKSSSIEADNESAEDRNEIRDRFKNRFKYKNSAGIREKESNEVIHPTKVIPNNKQNPTSKEKIRDRDTQIISKITKSSVSSSTSSSSSPSSSIFTDPSVTESTRLLKSIDRKHKDNNNKETYQTRFITHTETNTITLTNTEFSILTDESGNPITHTIMITTTMPPETVISTIIGSVTLVNTVDITPTFVRSTIIPEPTRPAFNFNPSTEKTKGGDSNSKESKEDKSSSSSQERNKIQGQILTISGVHHPRNTNTSPPPRIAAEPTTINDIQYEAYPIFNSEVDCKANCSFNRNQMCRSFANGTKSRCVCKPGYARMKSNYQCRDTFSYELGLAISHMEGMSFDFKDLKNEGTDAYLNFISVTKDALDKAFLDTDIKRYYQGSDIMKVKPKVIRRNQILEPKVGVDFLVQLSRNMSEERIINHLLKTLKGTNFTIGNTGISSTQNMSDFSARDFDECSNILYNDCSSNSHCINVQGSYLCKCHEGFNDRSQKAKPGRECYEMAGCPQCNYRGNCYEDQYGNPSCDCFVWFGGAECQINLKVLLITIIGVGIILFVLVVLCGIMICRRKKPRRDRGGSGRFMRYRSPTSQATLERTAIVNDSSSSDGTQTPPGRLLMAPPHNHSFTPDSLLMENSECHPKGVMRGQRGGGGMDNIGNDRSLAVVIPRAKIRGQTSSSRPPSRNPIQPHIHSPMGDSIAANERKLLSYLDHGSFTPVSKNPMIHSRQSSIRQSESSRGGGGKLRKLSLQERRISSGALVSSGQEVSARGGGRRRSTGLPEPDNPMFRGYEKSVSEARSYDETTVRSHAKPLFSGAESSRASCYSHQSHGCKPPSYCAYSESAGGHTMAEKDGASTVYTTQGKLFHLSQDSDSNSLSD